MYNYISIKYIDIFKCNYIKVFSMGGKKDFHIILPGRGCRQLKFFPLWQELLMLPVPHDHA